jgi:hypothetical protein
MKKLLLLGGFAGFAFLNSCVDHEVIPPPVPLVDLNCECEALINDSLVVYNDICTYSSTKEIVAGGPSTAQYKTQIKSEDFPGGLEIEIRNMNWIDDGSNNPNIEEWKTFFIDNPTPGYSDNIDHNGIVVRWTDPNGNIWVSDTNETVCVKEFIFNSLIQESDTTGKYMQFDATLDCKLLNSDYGTTDSVKCLVNGQVRSSFKLE